jgi:O-antigen biosynthesis protein
MNLSIIIPNYNGEDLLRKNLPKVIGSVGGSEIIVIDDASTDGSLKVLSDFKSRIKILRNEKNLGFPLSVNKAVRIAKGEIVILLNTDVAPEKTFLIPLIAHFKNSEVFAVGCLDKSVETGNIIYRGRGIGEWKKGFLAHSRGEIDRPSTLWVNGGSGAFRKSIWEKFGGFNELYSPFYWEDIDLSYRALKSGYKVIFEPKSVVTHEHEKGAIKNTYSNYKIKTIAYRNQFIFVWENATDYSLQFFHLVFLPYHFIKALFRLDVAFFMGFLKAFILLPGIMISSFKYQKLFVKTDRKVMEEFSK